MIQKEKYSFLVTYVFGLNVYFKPNRMVSKLRSSETQQLNDYAIRLH